MGKNFPNDIPGGAPGPGAYSPFMPNQSGRTHGILIETWQFGYEFEDKGRKCVLLKKCVGAIFLKSLLFFSMVSQEHIFKKSITRRKRRQFRNTFFLLSRKVTVKRWTIIQYTVFALKKKKHYPPRIKLTNSNGIRNMSLFQYTKKMHLHFSGQDPQFLEPFLCTQHQGRIDPSIALKV